MAQDDTKMSNFSKTELFSTKLKKIWAIFEQHQYFEWRKIGVYILIKPWRIQLSIRLFISQYRKIFSKNFEESVAFSFVSFICKKFWSISRKMFHIKISLQFLSEISVYFAWNFDDSFSPKFILKTNSDSQHIQRVLTRGLTSYAFLSLSLKGMTTNFRPS